jgi:hypothetical protein
MSVGIKSEAVYVAERINLIERKKAILKEVPKIRDKEVLRPDFEKEELATIHWIYNSSFKSEYYSLLDDYNHAGRIIANQLVWGGGFFADETIDMVKEHELATRNLLDCTKKIFNECDDPDVKKNLDYHIESLSVLADLAHRVMEHLEESKLARENKSWPTEFEDSITKYLEAYVRQFQQIQEKLNFRQLLQGVANDDLIDKIKESYLNNTNKEDGNSRFSICT